MLRIKLFLLSMCIVPATPISMESASDSVQKQFQLHNLMNQPFCFAFAIGFWKADWLLAMPLKLKTAFLCDWCHIYSESHSQSDIDNDIIILKFESENLREMLPSIIRHEDG